MKRIVPISFLICAALSMSLIGLVGCGGDDSSGGTTTITVTNTPTADPFDTTVASLEGKSWNLVSYGSPGSETAVISGTSIGATFNAGGVGGNSGCNSYNGGYNADNTGNLSVGALSSTLMLCFPPERMAQEGAYLAALENATAFRIDGSQLEIMYGSGQHLLFN